MSKDINDQFDIGALEDMHEKISGSAAFLSIFTKNYVEDPTAMLQLAYAFMLDKPLYLIVPEGTPIPNKIRKAADKIEFFTDQADMKKKVTKMLAEYMT